MYQFTSWHTASVNQIHFIQPFFFFPCLNFMRLIPILPIFHGLFTITQFSVSVPQGTTYPLRQVGQFMQKGFYIQLLVHVGIQFYKKVTGAISFTSNITVSKYILTFQTTMYNINRDFVTWKVFVQKPRGNILTEDFRITVSRMADVRHEPQWRNQMKELMKISLCVAVMFIPIHNKELLPIQTMF